MGRLDVWKPHRHWQQNRHLLRSSCFTLFCLMYLPLAAFPCLVFKEDCSRSWVGREEPGILALKKLCPVCHLQVKNWVFSSYFPLSFPCHIHLFFFYIFLALFHCFVHFPSLHPCSISFHLSLSPIWINYYIHYINTRELFPQEKVGKFSPS